MFRVEYRPKTFSEIIGLKTEKFILMSSVREKDIKKSYLFTGDSSVGKTTLARVFSKAILCQNVLEDGSPCCLCSSCMTLEEKRNPSYLEIDAGSQGGVDDVNELKQDLAYESLTSHRIIVFDEAHRISKAGKDSLLQELDNPDNNAIFIFCTTEENQMPPQLKSRCISFRLTKPSNRDVVEKLLWICSKEGIDVEDESSLISLVESNSTRYRDSENSLELLKFYKKVNMETVSAISYKKVDVVANLLINLAINIKEALEIVKELSRFMQIEDIYDTLLTLIVDSIKLSYGVVFEDLRYKETLNKILRCYETCLVDLMEYVLLKGRLNNLTTLQSDMILIHHRISKGQFKISREDTQSQAKIETIRKPTDLVNLIGKKSSTEINAKLRDLKYAKPKEGSTVIPKEPDPHSNTQSQDKFFNELDKSW